MWIRTEILNRYLKFDAIIPTYKTTLQVNIQEKLVTPKQRSTRETCLVSGYKTLIEPLNFFMMYASSCVRNWNNQKYDSLDIFSQFQEYKILPLWFHGQETFAYLIIGKRIIEMFHYFPISWSRLLLSTMNLHLCNS